MNKGELTLFFWKKRKKRGEGGQPAIQCSRFQPDNLAHLSLVSHGNTFGFCNAVFRRKRHCICCGQLGEKVNNLARLSTWKQNKLRLTIDKMLFIQPCGCNKTFRSGFILLVSPPAERLGRGRACLQQHTHSEEAEWTAAVHQDGCVLGAGAGNVLTEPPAHGAKGEGCNLDTVEKHHTVFKSVKIKHGFYLQLLLLRTDCWIRETNWKS